MKEDLIQQYTSMFAQPAFQYNWPDGWDELVTNLVCEINKTNSDVEVVQIKEKFGGLRFYYSNGNEAVQKLVNEAEIKSYTICQTCGKNGASQCVLSGWITTLCENCNKNTNS